MNKVTKSVLWALVAFIILKFLPVFYPAKPLWGFNQLTYLPYSFSIITSLVALLCIGWGMSAKKAKARPPKQGKKKAEKKEPASDKIILLCLIAGAGILFATVQIAWSFLGDGSAFLGAIFKFHTQGKMEFTPLEAPPMFVIYAIYYIAELAGHTMSSFFPFSVIGVITGMGFVYFGYRLSQVITKEKPLQWLTFILLLASGGTLFFFGYVETYHLQYLFVLIYSYEALCYIENKRTILAPAIALFICIVFHLHNFLLVPSFVLLYSLKNVKERKSADKSAFISKGFFVAAPLLLLIYAYFQWHPLTDPPSEPQNPFIPFFAFKGFSYTLLSAQRILDILNENLLLAGVPFVVMIALAFSARRSIRIKDPYFLFLITNLLFFEAYLIGGNAGFGLARDWDIFAAIGIFAALIASTLLRDIGIPASSQKKLAIPIVIVSVVTITSWVSLNVRISSSSARYEDIVEIYTPMLETKWAMMGFENLRKFFVSRDIEGELRVIRKMVDLSPQHTTVQSAESDAMQHIRDLTPGAKEEFRRIIDRLGASNDSLLKEEVFAKVRIGPHGSGESITLGEQFEDGVMILYRKFGMLSLDDAIRKTDDFITKHPMLPYGYELRGFLTYLFKNDAKGAIPFTEKAIAIDSLRSRPYLYHALALAKLGERKSANEEFRAALTLDAGWLGGLTYYSSFIADRENTVITREDVAFASERLKRVISAPPESSLEAHIEAQRAKAMLAARLLGEIEKKQTP